MNAQEWQSWYGSFVAELSPNQRAILSDSHRLKEAVEGNSFDEAEKMVHRLLFEDERPPSRPLRGDFPDLEDAGDPLDGDNSKGCGVAEADGD